MATIITENGKRVEELVEINSLSSDSYFLVSDKNLSRKIKLKNLRNAFCGDVSQSDKNNLYYSCESIDNKIDEINKSISNVARDLENLQTSLDERFKSMDKSILDIGNDGDYIKKKLIGEDIMLTKDSSGNITPKSGWGSYNNLISIADRIETIVGRSYDSTDTHHKIHMFRYGKSLNESVYDSFDDVVFFQVFD